MPSLLTPLTSFSMMPNSLDCTSHTRAQQVTGAHPSVPSLILLRLERPGEGGPCHPKSRYASPSLWRRFPPPTKPWPLLSSLSTRELAAQQWQHFGLHLDASSQMVTPGGEIEESGASGITIAGVQPMTLPAQRTKPRTIPHISLDKVVR